MKKIVTVLITMGLCISPINAAKLITEEAVIVNENTESNQEEIIYLERAIYNEWLSQHGIVVGLGESESLFVTPAEVAETFCQLLNMEGVYLPIKEHIDDPYIGRLVIEGIWNEQMNVSEDSLLLQDWETLVENLSTYLTTNKAIKHSESIREKELKSYRQLLDTPLPFKTEVLGKMTLSERVLKVEENSYELYQWEGNHYISFETLKHMGYTIVKGQKEYSMVQGESVSQDDTKGEAKINISLCNERLHYKDIESYLLKGKEELFVPLRLLEIDYSLQVKDKEIILVDREREGHQYLIYEEDKLINQSIVPIEVTAVSHYWSGEQQRQEIYTIHLEPGEAMPNTKLWFRLYHEQYLYTQIREIQFEETKYETSSNFGQDWGNLLSKYEKVISQKLESKKTELFPTSVIMATLIVDTNGMKKGEKVEVLKENKSTYSVKDSTGKTITIAKGKISIPSSPIASSTIPNKSQIEDFINSKDIKSATSNLLWTDLYHQRTYIFEGSNQNWQLIKIMPCSTGRNATPTPKGFYTLDYKVPSFGQAKGYCCKYACAFIGTEYLYHSVIYDKTGSYITSGKKELGQRASQGCIRLSTEDSKWIYDNMAIKTKVWIN